MTVSKSAITITSLALALLFGGGVYLLTNINLIAKNYIEHEASRTLGVHVTLGSLNIDLKGRSARATDLVIGNPQGFEKPYAAKAKTITVVLGPSSKQLAQFKNIDVVGTEVNLEVHDNITNLAAIKNNTKTPEEGPAAEAMKVIIDKLTISQAQIKPGAVLFTSEDLAPVPVPDIILTGIGRKENGILVHDVIGQVWAHAAHKLDAQALQAGLLEGMDQDALREMGLGFGARFKENLQQSVQDKVDAIGEGIDTLFND